MRFTKSVTKMLKNIAEVLNTASEPALDELGAEIKDMEERLSRPLRVAVVGVMKAGKSTLINAILKEKILYTGALETTYTVSWFKYGEEPRLKIVFYDKQKQPISAPYEDLEKWTVRPENAMESPLGDVEYVEIYYPNEILKTMELIDTPGLESTYEIESDHTKRFLGQKADEVSQKTASKAEAVLYAFSRVLQGRDADVLQAFKGDSSNSSPLNAIGIFTKIDIAWNCARALDENEDPFKAVSEATNGFKEKLKDKLYTIKPVTAKMVETVCDLNDQIFAILTRLAAVEQAELLDILADSEVFTTEPASQGMPVEPVDRALVLKMFGQYGIYVITEALRDNVAKEDLVEYLYKISGVEAAFQVIRKHFGNRAYLIKLEYILRRLRQTASAIKHNYPNKKSITRVCNMVLEDIDKLRANEQSLRELELLQSYYNKDFELPPGEQELEKQLLQITGEYGSNCEARLGFTGAAKVSAMKREAMQRSQRWNKIANDFGAGRALRQAAEVIVSSCNNLYYHLDMLAGFEE